MELIPLHDNFYWEVPMAQHVTRSLMLLVWAIMLPGLSRAASATATFNVSATVTATCTISAASLSFGSYEPALANATVPLDVNGSVTVRCTKGTTATIGLDQGSHAATGSTTTTPLRQMINDTSLLRYDLFRTAAGTDVWGDIGTPNVQSYSATNNGSQTLTVFGRIPAAQDVPTGSYSDTVTATINF
jgi:spore coat protein U domain-containing protein, fimbrial subunit CupE1/2/3/6